MRRAIACAAAGLVIACAPLPRSAAETSDPQAASIAELHPCKAEAAQALLNQPALPANVARAVRLSGSSTARIFRPGQPVAMDYRTDRLTIEVDGLDKIIAISCG